MSEGVVLALGPRLHVSVDFWRRARLPVAGHFLTHMHADHTEGLGDDWRSAGGGAIYCSPATRQLLQVLMDFAGSGSLSERCAHIPCATCACDKTGDGLMMRIGAHHCRRSGRGWWDRLFRCRWARRHCCGWARPGAVMQWTSA